MPILPRQYAESRLDSPGGSGGTAGTLAGPGGESDETVRSATLSARARQLTPQAVEREEVRGSECVERPAEAGGNHLHGRPGGPAGDPFRERRRGDPDRRRADGGGRPPRPAERDRSPDDPRPQRRGAGPSFGHDHTPGVLLLRGAEPEPEL